MEIEIRLDAVCKDNHDNVIADHLTIMNDSSDKENIRIYVNGFWITANAVFLSEAIKKIL